MIYREFQNLKLSMLGMGGMRLPVVDGDNTRLDQSAVEGLVDYAIAHGVNYFDTAWGYHGGHSEESVGAALSRHPRDSFCLADKFPGYDLANMDKVEEIFPQQLKRCGVDYFDFYLFHNVNEMNIDSYLDPKYGILDYLLAQKKSGKIRHLGFSAHGAMPVMERFLEAYGAHMEFCQLQINYIDWDFQDAKGKVALLERYHIPVWVMEPVRGGKLARLSEGDAAALKALRPDEGIPAWAFRFVQSIPGVKVILSGMTQLEMLKDNLNTFSAEKPLTGPELDALMGLAGEMVARTALPCTACQYCVDHCPQGLNIPDLLALYNEHAFTGGGFIPAMRLSLLPEDKRPSACLGCRSCEAVCPQQLKISEAMADFAGKK